MKILAIETATEACSVALRVDGQTLESFTIAPRQHTALLLPAAEKLLSDAGLHLSQIDAIAFGCGPGMFTGVRLAASAAQALAFAHDLPVAAISSLQALAQSAYQDFSHSVILAALDARMGEIYVAQYENQQGEMIAIQDELLISPAQLNWNLQYCVGVGSGVELFSEQLFGLMKIEKNCYPKASAVAMLAESALKQGLVTPAELALPNYLRDRVT